MLIIKLYLLNIKYEEGDIISYLVNKFKGRYRIKCNVDKSTNNFPKKLNGTYEDIDCYIDCQYGNKVFHYGRDILQAYIPSTVRGNNIIKVIDPNIIFDIEKTDAEVLFKFRYVNSDKIIPLLKPKISGASISPFSTKNLPKKSDFKIPDDKLETYKEIVANIPENKRLSIGIITNSFIKTLITKKNTWENIKSDMRLKCLKGKEYIYCIGKWNEYLTYLKSNIKNVDN